ncbi:TetR family transcriptional regulator [Hasllibacter halocynthiae]|uniref:TetR family transcriptional regulator n=1 Tax=Hasllibacter halocynthiae TaxID=595589 RepID=A0A2T0X326_9RHOB|nr:TetR/AcrR family transcriptional regulator [Hasllibacter halocynthiae]PRY93353.1 TetR family transcriptional regulator [Hasllibacter halocynthiae]
MQDQSPLPEAKPIQGRKVAQVVDGARAVFLRDGFEGASVDAIAREAGVSKATLYSYFADKRVLFLHVGKCECQRQSGIAMGDIDEDAPVAEVLTRAGLTMLEFITSEFGQRVFRICVAEGERFPALAREFYESGPLVMRAHLVDFLRKAEDRGELRIEDHDMAAEQFHELCKAMVLPRVIFGMGTPTEDERRYVVDEAVRTFLARYAAG